MTWFNLDLLWQIGGFGEPRNPRWQTKKADFRNVDLIPTSCDVSFRGPKRKQSWTYYVLSKFHCFTPGSVRANDSVDCLYPSVFLLGLTMKYSILSLVLVAFLVSSAFLKSVESSASFLRFGRTIGKRKYRARHRYHARTDEPLLPSSQRKTGPGFVGNVHLPRHMW